MDAKFSVNLAEYSTVTVQCPDCGRKYQLRLRRDRSALANRENSLVKIRCIECSKKKKVN